MQARDAAVALYVPGRRQIIEDILNRCRRSRTAALIVHSDPDAVSVAREFAERGVA